MSNTDIQGRLTCHRATHTPASMAKSRILHRLLLSIIMVKLQAFFNRVLVGVTRHTGPCMCTPKVSAETSATTRFSSEYGTPSSSAKLCSA
eukprot:6466744-Amphidinium_carterae.2